MRKNKTKWLPMFLLWIVMILGLIGYGLYMRQQFYNESTDNLLETYEQVNKTFTMFAQRNWNVLGEWGKSLHTADADGLTEERLQSFESERDTWQYSGVYLFNKSCEYWDTQGGHGSASHLRPAFEEMYRTGKATVSSYIMKNGERRVVFVVPIEPVTVQGTLYDCLAVSYANETMEEMIGGHSYGGQSDCYIVRSSGDVVLSEEPKSEIEARMSNLFDYLAENARVDAEELEAARRGVQNGGSGSMIYWLDGQSYYLVYQPVGFQELSIVGIVRRNVVDAGMQKIQNATILLLFALFSCAAVALVGYVKQDARQRVEEKENALHQEEQARQQMESLANSDGLTGLHNERYFNALLKEKAQRQEPFALFYLDLDQFKPVNDTYGHDVGDQLLKEVAQRLRGCVRESDYAFRIGGDEFALVVNGAMTEHFCQNRMEKIKQTIRQPYELKAGVIRIGTSCGYAIFPAENADVKEIRILADQRMYEDKQRSGHSRER